MFERVYLVPRFHGLSRGLIAAVSLATLTLLPASGRAAPTYYGLYTDGSSDTIYDINSSSGLIVGSRAVQTTIVLPNGTPVVLPFALPLSDIAAGADGLIRGLYTNGSSDTIFDINPVSGLIVGSHQVQTTVVFPNGSSALLPLALPLSDIAIGADGLIRGLYTNGSSDTIFDINPVSGLIVASRAVQTTFVFPNGSSAILPFALPLSDIAVGSDGLIRGLYTNGSSDTIYDIIPVSGLIVGSLKVETTFSFPNGTSAILPLALPLSAIDFAYLTNATSVPEPHAFCILALGLALTILLRSRYVPSIR